MRSDAGVCAIRAYRAARDATASVCSVFGTYRRSSPPPTPFCETASLKETGTVMMRPSSSGSATFIAMSRGLRPMSRSSHIACGSVETIACRIGTSSCSSTRMSQLASVLSLDCSPGWWLMAKLCVHTTTSTDASPSGFIRYLRNTAPSSSRKLEQKTGSALHPCRSRASTIVSTNSRFWLTQCAR